MYGLPVQIVPPLGPGIPPALRELVEVGTPVPAGKQVEKLR